MTPCSPVCGFKNVPVCTGTTRTCFNTCARGAGIHGDVLNVHTAALLKPNTVFFSVPQHTHTNTHTNTHIHTPNTHHDHQQHHDHNDTHHTTHSTQHHTETERKRQRERDRERQRETERDGRKKTEKEDRERRQRKRDKTRQEKSREKTRREKKQDKRRDKMKKREKMKEKRRDKMKKKREDERENERENEERQRWKKRGIFFVKNVSEHSNPPDKLAQHVSNKIPLGRIIPPFFLRKFRIWPFFNYLHDSNSIFRIGRMNSENVPGCTVRVLLVLLLLST